jgi:hypothetical protein
VSCHERRRGKRYTSGTVEFHNDLGGGCAADVRDRDAGSGMWNRPTVMEEFLR